MVRFWLWAWACLPSRGEPSFSARNSSSCFWQTLNREDRSRQCWQTIELDEPSLWCREFRVNQRDSVLIDIDSRSWTEGRLDVLGEWELLQNWCCLESDQNCWSWQEGYGSFGWISILRNRLHCDPSLFAWCFCYLMKSDRFIIRNFQLQVLAILIYIRHSAI